MMLRVLLALVLAASLAAPAAAQSELVAADSAEAVNHRLTEAEFAQFAAVVNRMDSVFQGNTRAFAGLEWKLDAPLTLDSLGTRYESHVAMRAELARAGMTGRAFFLTLAALMYAQRAVHMDDDSYLDSLPPAHAANARWVKSRQADVGRLFRILAVVRTED
ncbi:MAG TPA: hypothetical protein VLK84_13515 [Longimicrobium sp.]|nr:hypothetical protein [Longimicrobium sp.]